MAKGRQWTVQEEAELKTLADSNAKIQEVAAKLQKTPGAIIMKSKRLGLKLETTGYANTSVKIPKELPSVEEALRILAGALKASVKPGLDKVEVQRLQTVATIAKTYQELLADYINYREIENKLKKMEEQNAQLLKKEISIESTQNMSSQPDPSKMEQHSTSQ